MTKRYGAPIAQLLVRPDCLARLQLRLASWTRRGFDTRERNPEIVARRLLRDLAPRDILLLHDGGAAITDDGQPVLLSVLPHVFDAAKKQGLHFITLREAF